MPWVSHDFLGLLCVVLETLNGEAKEMMLSSKFNFRVEIHALCKQQISLNWDILNKKLFVDFELVNFVSVCKLEGNLCQLI